VSKIKVVVFPNARNALGYYRLIYPAIELYKQGYHVQMVDPDDPQRIRYGLSSDGRVVDAIMPPADVIVVQRVTQPRMIEVMQVWQSKGAQVVLDMDDDFTASSRLHNPDFYRLMHDPRGETSWQATLAAAKVADRVVVASKRLHKVYGGSIVRNYIPDFVYDAFNIPDKYKLDDTWGWTGEWRFRRTDPSVMGDAPKRLYKAGYKMAIVGPSGPSVRAAFGVPEIPPASGTVPLEQYPFWLARLPVYAVPLTESPFNHAKSWLTPLMMAAVGAVPVMSPHPEYDILFSKGVGLRAWTPEEWYSQIRRVLEDADYRHDLIVRGRRVALRYRMSRHATRFWEAWTGVASDVDMCDTDAVSATDQASEVEPVTPTP
jgi:hypothetical protein